jgi:hypothetical protein
MLTVMAIMPVMAMKESHSLRLEKKEGVSQFLDNPQKVGFIKILQARRPTNKD